MRFGAENRLILVLAVVLFVLLGNACAQTNEQKMKIFDAHEEKARIFRREHNFEAALQEQLKAVELYPENAGSLIILGNIYIELQQWDKAIETLHKANEINAQDERGYYLQALALEGKGEKEKAIETLHKALEITPEDTLFLAKLAYLYDDTGNKRMAKETYNHVLAIDPKYVPAIYNLATLEEEDNNYEKAVVLFKKSIELEPNNKERVKRAKAKIEELESKKSVKP